MNELWIAIIFLYIEAVVFFTITQYGLHFDIPSQNFTLTALIVVQSWKESKNIELKDVVYI